VEAFLPTALIGVSGQPATFTREVLETMAWINRRPIIFALSNPTSKSECTAAEAYGWTDGRAIFASGSPFEPVSLNEKVYVPGQGNNAYVFPGIGLGILASGAQEVTDEMFLAAAKALAAEVDEDDLACGRIYPPLNEIRAVSQQVAAAVATIAYQQKLATEPTPENLCDAIRAQMYDPHYPIFVDEVDVSKDSEHPLARFIAEADTAIA
jgi:malate dehydrogenase (oxaloacetate-decarboxylating)(NADP+)